MRKLIDIPKEIEINLKGLAVKSGKDLKNYIQDLHRKRCGYCDCKT